MDLSARELGLMLMLCAVLAGGGGSTLGCSPTSLSVSPQSANADSNAAPPGNSQQFTAGAVVAPGCPALASTLPSVRPKATAKLSPAPPL